MLDFEKTKKTKGKFSHCLVFEKIEKKQKENLRSTDTAKLPTYGCRTCKRHGHNPDMDTRSQTWQVCTQEEKSFFNIRLFYFDVEYCFLELFLWMSSLFELFLLISSLFQLFCSYFKKYFTIFKIILDTFPNISSL